MDDTALERDLEVLLRVDPAPEFRARLRQRIHAEAAVCGQHAVPWFAWAAGCTALGVAVLISAVTLRESVQPPPVLLNARPIEAVGYLRSTPIASNVRWRAPHEQRRAAQVRPAAWPPVIIDPSEVAAWHRLLRDLGSHEASIPVVHAAAESTQPLPDEYVIPPVTIEPLNPEFAAEGVRP